MAEALVIAKELGRKFGLGPGSVEAVRDINIAILPGEHIALVGPSGSGKSTLLHLLGGLDRPTVGSLAWPMLGKVDELRPRHIGFVFQGPSLFPALTVAQNVALPLVLAGEHELSAHRAATLLNAFQLSCLADKLPEELSGGQAQRVAMARAFATGPKLILADEPTGQLDGRTARSFFDEVLNQVDLAGAALIAATHDRTIADRFHRRWIMVHGRLFSDTESGQV